MAKWLVVVALLALAGCGSPMDGHECASPSGFYETTWNEISGDCGLGSWIKVENFDAPVEGLSCTGDRYADQETCSAYIDLNCLDVASGASLKMAGVVDWNEDASIGRGELTMVPHENGRDLCMSTYDVKYRRL